MLVVIAVIGIIAAIAVPSIGAITGKANTAKAKRNGQTIAALYNASRGVGAVYTATNTNGIIDELVVGKTGADLAATDFKMSGLSNDEKAAAMEYVSYDSASDLMMYYPDGGAVQEAVAVEGWWGDWTPTEGESGFFPTPGAADEAEAAQLAAQARAAYPNLIVSHRYYYGNWQIEYFWP